MGLIAFLVEEKGKDPSGAAVQVDRDIAPSAFSRAVEELSGRDQLADPDTRHMIAGHFAEVALSKAMAGDEVTAEQAASALLTVLDHPYVLVRANLLRGDIEITDFTPIEAASPEEAEAVFAASMERLTSGEPEH